MGSTCETEVRMELGPTRFPICTRAMPAIPLTSDVTFVNSTFSSACSTLAFAARTSACAPSFAWISVSSWLFAIARASASGVSRSTSRLALPSCASACASCAFA